MLRQNLGYCVLLGKNLFGRWSQGVQVREKRKYNLGERKKANIGSGMEQLPQGFNLPGIFWEEMSSVH